MTYPSPSTSDPFYLGEFFGSGGPWNSNTGFSDTSSKTLRNQTLNTAIRNLVLVIAGQSLREAQTPTAYVPTNASAIDNFNVYDGAVYAWADPPLGSGYQNGGIAGGGVGHLGARIADKFISGSIFDRVIVVPVAIGSSSVAQWASGGALQNRLPATMARLKARGFVAQTNVTVAIEWGQGETDNINGTTQSAYATSLSSVISNVRSAGFSGRFFVAQESWASGAASSAVAAAQAAAVNGTTVFASGNIDTLNATNRLADNIHLNDTGAAAAATLIFNAMVASGAPF